MKYEKNEERGTVYVHDSAESVWARTCVTYAVERVEYVYVKRQTRNMSYSGKGRFSARFAFIRSQGESVSPRLPPKICLSRTHLADTPQAYRQHFRSLPWSGKGNASRLPSSRLSLAFPLFLYLLFCLFAALS